MHKIWVIALAVVGLGALGWWGYQSQRVGPRPALEITGKSAPAQAAGDRAAAADGPRARPDAQAGERPRATGQTGPAGAAASRGPVGVEVAEAQRVALADEVLAVGTLRAKETVVVKPEIPGRIVSIGFSDGARVRKGEVLVRLDDSVLAAQVEQARAERGLAQANYERAEDLAKRNFISGSARDQAAATLKVQSARLELAEAQLAKTRIAAPFSGVLGLRNVSVGDFVKDGAELVTLEDISSMKVDLRLPERYLGQLRRGQVITIAVDAFPERRFEARLDALDVQIDANGRSLLARGRLENPDGALRSGMFAKARIVLREKPDAVVIPEEAILPAGSEAYVFRLENNRAMRTRVETGIRREGKVEIVSGLSAGDLVVTAGQLRLRGDAMEVRVVDGGRRAPAAGSSTPAQPPAKTGG